jgi:predicted thioesterase
VGHSISVTHLGPSRVGDRVTTRARLLEVRGNRIVCTVEAFNETGKIGEGTQVQVLLSKDTLQRLADPPPTVENPRR